MLESTIQKLFIEGITSRTRSIALCQNLNINPLPLTERSLCLFAAYLATYAIKVYMSALRHLQISARLPAPHSSSWPWLQFIIKGIDCTQAPDATSPLLHRQLQDVCPRNQSLLGSSLPGFFRLGEILPQSQSNLSYSLILPSILAQHHH